MRRHLHLAGRSAYYVVGVVLLLLALGMGALSQLMPWIEHHPGDVQAWLSARAGRPVAFSRLDAHWTRRGPLLQLGDLRVGDPRNAVHVGDAELLVSQYSGWLPGHKLTELRLRGMALTLERQADGEWRVRGLPGQATGGDPLSALERLGELQVVNGRLHVLAPSLDVDLQVPRIDVRTQVNGARVRVGMRGWLAGSAQPVDAVMDFDRVHGDGRVYVGSRKLDLRGHSDVLHAFGVALATGEGRMQAWLDLRARTVRSVVASATLSDVTLRSEVAGNTAPPVRLQSLDGLWRFRRARTDWRLDVPKMTVVDVRGTQQLDGVQLAGGRASAARAARIDLPMVASIASLSSALPAGLSKWLAAAAPSGSLRDMRFDRMASGVVRVDATADALGFRPVGHAPGLAGVSGRVLGDADAIALAFDPSSTFTFDWPTGFGVRHGFHPSGTVVAWREGGGVRVGTDSLQLRGPDASVETRGGMWWQGDGTRPRIDIAAGLIADASLANARGFWVHDRMSPATIAWLNGALQGGRMVRADAVVSGDLDDWPFDRNNGLFEVDADVRDLHLKFQPDWPEYSAALTHVRFTGPGMHVEGEGSIAGVHVARATADIPHFGLAELSVHGEGAGDASKLLDLLKQSPLQKDLGSVFSQLQVAGPAQATFDLMLPFHDALPYTLKGGVELQGVHATHKAYAVSFDAMRGHATFDRHGFDAEQLTVVREGQPGSLNLRAGGGVRDARNVFEAELDAQSTAHDLLARVPDLGWLQPHVQGRSRWTVAVDVPPGGAANHIELRSDLVGTAIDLPAPLAKPAATPWPTVVALPLPLGTGEVSVALGRAASVRARQGSGRTGVQVTLGGQPAGTPPAGGLQVDGHASSLDALAWLGVLNAPGGSAGASIELRGLDVSADRLLLGGAVLPSTQLRVQPVAAGRQVIVRGPALQGGIFVPKATTAPIVARIDHLRWAPSAGNAATTPATGAATMLSDPAAIPPLQFDIADLRIGPAAFSNVALRTHPVAGGLRVDQLHLGAPQQQIDMTGSWLGTARASRTQLQARVTSGNFGKLLDAFGFEGQLASGRGTLQLDGGWPGGPTDLQLAALNGDLAIDVQDGRLAKVEPGVGRVLGLLSLAQLPRRLTLDFRDFFDKGFAFNSMAGHIHFGGGRARSTDLAIKGPAADIRIEGAADMAAQRFDQTIHVFPKTGNVLTVAGALTAGPVGAAIGAVAGAILKKPFSQIAEKTYRVTGPWADPKVEAVQGQAAPAR